MRVATKNFVWTAAGVRAMLGANLVVPAGALWTTPKMGLFSGEFNPTPTSVFADLVSAAFSGYTTVTIATTQTIVSIDGYIWGILAQRQFNAAVADPFISGTANGYFVFDGTSVLYGAERFANPVPFSEPGNFLALDALFPISCNTPIPNNWGGNPG